MNAGVIKSGIMMLTAGVLVSGCATTQKPGELELSGLRGQVSELQATLEACAQENNALRNALSAQMQQAQAALSQTDATEKKARPGNKDIQTALKNAGYDPGVIDGKLGRQTRDAIKEFQKANGLKADGKVGKQTWELLQKYLEMRTK